jgi:hypothetical protein
VWCHKLYPLEDVGRSQIRKVSQWFKSKGLCLNLRKTKVLKFDAINRNSMPVHLKFNDELLQEEIHVKFLGIEIDKFLNWKTQVESLLPGL